MKTVKLKNYIGTIEFVVDKIVAWTTEPLVGNILTVHTVSTEATFEYETKEEMNIVAQLLYDAVWEKK